MPIRYGDFLSMEFEPASYDCITMWAVLEHVYAPSKFIERIANLLKPGGKLVVLVTNLNSIQSRFYGLDDYPRHLTIFTAASARRLCSKYGLNTTRFHTGQEVFGGALNGGLVYATKRLLGYSSDEVMSEWKCASDNMLFCGKFRGRTSGAVLNVSRLDRALTLLPEKILDRFGFTLTFSAIK